MISFLFLPQRKQISSLQRFLGYCYHLASLLLLLQILYHIHSFYCHSTSIGNQFFIGRLVTYKRGLLNSRSIRSSKYKRQQQPIPLLGICHFAFSSLHCPYLPACILFLWLLLASQTFAIYPSFPSFLFCFDLTTRDTITNKSEGYSRKNNYITLHHLTILFLP